jgi:hypothetical protein
MTTEPTDFDDDAFMARAGISSTGLLDECLKTHVDLETAEKFRRKTREAGTDTSGALRDWIYVVVHGKTFTDIQIDAAKVKRDALFGTGPAMAQIEPKS